MVSFNLKKPIYIALKSIPITLKPHFCPYSTIIFLEVFRNSILKIKKHYKQEYFYHYDDKKSTIFYYWRGKEEDDWLNNRK